MGALEDAPAHLAKAEQFLAAADATLDLDLFDAATSSAVSCAINAKDAVCLQLTGRTSKTENHKNAAKELRTVGAAAVSLVPTFERLLSLKKKAQYQTTPITRAEAARAVEWAHRMYGGAQEILRG